MLSKSCYMIDVVDVITEDTMEASLHRDPLDALMCLEFSADDAGLHKRIVDALEAALDGKELTDAQVEEIVDMPHTSYAVEVTVPERKPLLFHLKYVFLDDTEQYTIIVNASLSENQLADLLIVLKRHKQALSYYLDDLKGISPEFCIHRIHLEEGHRLCVQA
ncbi:hypothetical protein vseg_017777 [Gypsophila vaccaria]